jgi:hypothetical protein
MNATFFIMLVNVLRKVYQRPFHLKIRRLNPRKGLSLLRSHPILLLLIALSSAGYAQRFDTLGLGWSKTSVNAVIFRKNSITSNKDLQYASYYDTSGFVVLAMRKKNEPWQMVRTDLSGNVADAHNTISIMVDGSGYLHLAWDLHNTRLKYVRSKWPGSLELTEPMEMIGKDEERMSYPEFYRMPGGDLIFLYRDGESGRGNLIMNRYNTRAKTWQRVQTNLIDGENQRSAYWQACISGRGTIHLSWVWRETPDVASNHDICYARSHDGGVTWEKTNGQRYHLPITASTAEYAIRIPQGSDLINQTSMSATDDDHPAIVTYWKDDKDFGPQIKFGVHNKGKWEWTRVTKRAETFSLKGGGTKSIPIARPQLLIWGKARRMKGMIIGRDNAQRTPFEMYYYSPSGWQPMTLVKLGPNSPSAWEPTYDVDLFKRTGKVAVFLQDVGQGDGETLAEMKPTPVVIMTLD